VNKEGDLFAYLRPLSFNDALEFNTILSSMLTSRHPNGILMGKSEVLVRLCDTAYLVRTFRALSTQYKCDQTTAPVSLSGHFTLLCLACYIVFLHTIMSYNSRSHLLL
jgi:hypothetical protein